MQRHNSAKNHEITKFWDVLVMICHNSEEKNPKGRSRGLEITPQESQPTPKWTFKWGSAHLDKFSLVVAEEDWKLFSPALVEPGSRWFNGN